jgi:hypothetical protein
VEEKSYRAREHVNFPISNSSRFGVVEISADIWINAARGAIPWVTEVRAVG